MGLGKLEIKAIEYLIKDEIANIDILEAIRRGVADIIYAGADGVIIYEQISRACMASMCNFEKFKRLVNIDNYDFFALHQKNLVDWVKNTKKFSDYFEAYQAAYMKKEKIDNSFDGIKKLSRKYLDCVSRSYNAMEDREYIEELIDRGHMWGIFDGEKLAGFIGIHSEGSIGLLEIFPEFRRKGYGTKLEEFLINYFLELNMIPFCQVMLGNEKSFELQKKIGMEISKETVTWLF